MGAEHTSLLYYSSARSFARGNILLRTLELRQKIYVFLKEEEHKNANEFSDIDFLMKLAYLCDIFENLNALNIFSRKKYANFEFDGKNFSINKKKHKLWKIKINEGDSKDAFSILHQFSSFNGAETSLHMKSIFEDHLSQLVMV